MLRPSGTSVLPFKIKKASLALRIESRLEKTFSMSLAVWLGEDMFILTINSSGGQVGRDIFKGFFKIGPELHCLLFGFCYP